MKPDPHRNPEALLAAIQATQAQEGRGRFKVFLGMCPGVGKTYAMLEAAHREAASGRSVAIGYVESHGRPETDALTAGLESIPRRHLQHRGVDLGEMDLDAILARRPSLVLVDELAHTNAPGSRHPKRWQDVREILDAGIDVFTTVNVQHLESRADTVRQITGTQVRETVPDSVLDDAVLELVDLPAAELLSRLRAGRVYPGERANAAAEGYFRESNLTALRELALRLVADHVGDDTARFRRAQAGHEPWKTGNRLLVAVGPSPHAESLLRWTRRRADELQCPWLAVHVEGPIPLAPADQERLSRNLETARTLGALTVTSSDEDLARGLLRVAREHNVTQIIVGKPGGPAALGWLTGGRVLWRLVQQSGDIDLQVVRPVESNEADPRPRTSTIPGSPWSHYGIAAGIVAATGLLNVALLPWTGPRVAGYGFLVAVVGCALLVGRGPVIFAGALGAAAWNFLLLPPRFTFRLQQREDAFLLGTQLVVALLLGQLVARIRIQREAERRREQRSAVLHDLTRSLAECGSRDEIVWQLIAAIDRACGVPATVCLPSGSRLVAHPDGTFALDESEAGVADWSFRQQRPAGRSTDNLPGARALHLPLVTERRTVGVLVIPIAESTLPTAQRELLESLARQAALVLDREDLRSAAERSRLAAESDRLSRTLLSSISHELRTPLAASTSAATALANTPAESSEQRQSLLDEIQQANARLNRVIGNLLDATRLESGQVRPRLDWHDVRDLAQGCLQELRRELAQHPVTLTLPPGPMLARLDYSLVQHALGNLLSNAAAHTPPGTPIELRAQREPTELILTVSDAGPGIPPDHLHRIFDRFHRVPGTPAGGSGLGLTLVRGFIEAHGGFVSAGNRPSGGAQFIVRIPQNEAAPTTP